MKINLLVAPYRDAYFFDEYGSAVRDLQFLETLSKVENISKITLLNRPVSILERILFKKPKAKRVNLPKIKTIDLTSKDLFGAIKGRAWADDVYPSTINNLLQEYKCDDSLNIFLDFLPIGKFHPERLDGWVYWYDFIDNFTKHNRFTKKEKQLVQQKYSFISKYADFISGVSDVCIKLNGPYEKAKTEVISNKVFDSYGCNADLQLTEKRYDFGFIGFVTDKLDIAFIKKLSDKYSVAIFGQVMDKDVGKILSSLDNVTTFGKFSYKEVPNICKQFKIGLLPYLAEKSHDGSPLKLYEYMKYNVPCLTSIDYEITDNSFIRNYNKSTCLEIDIKEMSSISGNQIISKAIKPDWKLDASLNRVVINLLKLGEELHE